jgi:hypothetical protein
VDQTEPTDDIKQAVANKCFARLDRVFEDTSESEGGWHSGKRSWLEREERQAVRGAAEKGNEQITRRGNLEFAWRLQQRRKEFRQQPE